MPRQEGLWWFDDGETRPAAEVPRDEWNWTLLIRLPEFAAEGLNAAIEVARKKKPALATIDDVYCRRLEEGRCVQMMHHGPYSAEPETVARIREYLVEHSLEISATHHEIYVSDARRLPEEKWTTVLRFPVRPLSVGADGGPAID